MRHRIIRAALALAVVLGIGVIAPQHASAAVAKDETYACTYVDPGSDPDQHRTCDGSWYHGANSYFGRSIRIVAAVEYNQVSGWRYTGIKYVQNFMPWLQKRIEWRCRYANGTTSSMKASTTLGSSPYPDRFSWSGAGYQPCNGYSTGMVASVIGGDSFCGEEVFVSLVDINSNTSGVGKQRGQQQMCASVG